MADGDWWDDEVESPGSYGHHHGSGLEAFDDYAPVEEREEDNWSFGGPAEGGQEESPAALFTVTNPPGTVSATATLGGRIDHIDIFDVSEFSEAQLADEIVSLVELARAKAQAAQHAVTVHLMRGLGHDRVETSSYLEHSIGLPAPDAVDARTAEVFAARYSRRTE
jgi:hypothetical protein